MDNDISRRLKAVRVEMTVIPLLLTEGYITGVIKGLPKGAEFCRAYADPTRDQFILIFRHESFEPTNEGECIPEMRVEFYSAGEEIIPLFGDVMEGFCEKHVT